MSDPIDLSAERSKREAPDPEHVSFDDDGRPLYRFGVEYDHDGGVWTFDLWAYDRADAEAKAASMSAGGVRVYGQIYARIDA